MAYPASAPDSPNNSQRLDIALAAPILAMTRTARTTTPIAQLTVAARTDRFEADYLVYA